MDRRGRPPAIRASALSAIVLAALLAVRGTATHDLPAPTPGLDPRSVGEGGWRTLDVHERCHDDVHVVGATFGNCEDRVASVPYCVEDCASVPWLP